MYTYYILISFGATPDCGEELLGGDLGFLTKFAFGERTIERNLKLCMA